MSKAAERFMLISADRNKDAQGIIDKGTHIGLGKLVSSLTQHDPDAMRICRRWMANPAQKEHVRKTCPSCSGMLVDNVDAKPLEQSPCVPNAFQDTILNCSHCGRTYRIWSDAKLARRCFASVVTVIIGGGLLLAPLRLPFFCSAYRHGLVTTSLALKDRPAQRGRLSHFLLLAPFS
jgi:hypothetical protein